MRSREWRKELNFSNSNALGGIFPCSIDLEITSISMLNIYSSLHTVGE